MGCSAIPMCNTSFKEFYGKKCFKTNGRFNGYCDSYMYIEGRTNNANYCRLLIRGINGIMFMTKYAYDCELLINGNIKLYIWNDNSFFNLKKTIIESLGFDYYGSNYEYKKIVIYAKKFALLQCYKMVLSRYNVKPLIKISCDVYLAELPNIHVYDNA
jgi:hypothetical protein